MPSDRHTAAGRDSSRLAAQQVWVAAGVGRQTGVCWIRGTADTLGLPLVAMDYAGTAFGSNVPYQKLVCGRTFFAYPFLAQYVHGNETGNAIQL